MFGSDCDKQYVRRPPNQEFFPQFTLKTIKHGGGNIMVWGGFSYFGVGPIHWIKETMNAEIYRDILENVMLPFIDEDMPLLWVFQQDNDPKHKSKLVQKWLLDHNIEVLEWPAQSADLSPIENLWQEVKRQLKGQNPRNKTELWAAVKNAWYSIPPQRCMKLVDSMPRRLQQVLKNKGYSTKY